MIEKCIVSYFILLTCTLQIQQQSNNTNTQPTVEELITVEFKAVSAEDLAKLVAEGRFPATLHGADVFMQIANTEPQRVSIN